MKRTTVDALRQELISRGFSSELEAPNKTMQFTETYLRSQTLAEFLDQMVTRREKVWRSTPVVGREASRMSYDDVVLAIDAVKTVFDQRCAEAPGSSPGGDGKKRSGGKS